MPERFIILLEQGIDERDQASNHMTNGLSSSSVGLRSLVVGAKARDQALVQASPLCLGLDRIPRHQVHDPLQLTRSSLNVNSGIRTWADLAGKRVGVPDFNMTAAIWLRIMLKHLHGILAEDITWFNGRRPYQRHNTFIRFNDKPPGAPLYELKEGAMLHDLLARGEIDAAFGDGHVVPIYEGSNVRRLLTSDQVRQSLTCYDRMIEKI
jgi:ABC-type amino acid transport substrate-binding protein